MEYRKELKYFVSDSDLVVLESKINRIMQIDNNSINSIYNIRSIYFDTIYNDFYYENEDGLNERYKIRIRIYNKSSNLIKLEIKYKKNGLTKKESCNISKELCDKLINGEKLKYYECNSNVLRKMYVEQKNRLLSPKILIEYDRVAYINKIGNVRVTFDKNIKVSKNVKLLFDDNIYGRRLMEDNQEILEIKYDEIIPDYIKNQLEINTLFRSSFSKYYMSRMVMKEEVLWVLKIL